MAGEKLAAGDLKLLKQIVDEGHKLEAVWRTSDHDALFALQRLIASVAHAESHALSRLAFHARNLRIEMDSRHLGAILVPFERLLGRALRDDEFLVSDEDRTTPLAKPEPMKIIADNIRSAFNIGAIFRTGDCFGIEEVVLTGYTATPDDLKTTKTSLGTADIIPWRSEPEVVDVIRDLKKSGYKVVALETAGRAEDLVTFDWPDRCALLLGNERFGVEPEILNEVDHVVRIPMYGCKNSLNVGIALGVALNDWRIKRQHGPIGYFHSQAVNPYDVGRQGSVDQSGEVAVVQLKSGRGFEQALKDLDGFERVWLLYEFHQNKNWKPMVVPPRGPREKRGVFATRSPYRPNSIGLSCVELIKVDGLKVLVRSHDLLDGSPVLDIKPYLPYADSFPTSKIGWLTGVEQSEYKVDFTETARQQIDWLTKHDVKPIEVFLRTQLAFDPIDDSRKRVRPITDDSFEIAYRTWRARFTILGPLALRVDAIHSGYTETDLVSKEDKYEDKEIHKSFITRFAKDASLT